MTTARVDGRVAAGYEPVREAFAALLADGTETGAAVAVVRGGETVVDLCGGWRDAARREPWRAGTLVHVFSAGKAVAAVALLRLVDRGRLGLDDAVAAHWPEFAAAGKHDVTVRQVLAHAAGLPAFPRPVPAAAAGDWAALAGALAAAAPRWPVGTVVAEHALTYGHLVGELVRRVDGRDLGRYLREELPGADLALGLAPADGGRVAELECADPHWPATVLGGPGTLRREALGNPVGWLDPAVLNGDAWRAAQVPAVNLHATATTLAALYAGLLPGAAGGPLSPGLAAELARPQAAGEDALLGRYVRWGLGVQVEPDGDFGMGGIGGCDAYASPAGGYGYAYVTRRLAGHDRSERVIEALAGCL